MLEQEKKLQSTSPLLVQIAEAVFLVLESVVEAAVEHSVHSEKI
jgi:hypothetical protein